MMLSNAQCVEALQAGKDRWLTRAQQQTEHDIQKETLLKKAYYKVDAGGKVVDKDDPAGVATKVVFVTDMFDRLIDHGNKQCLRPDELEVLDFNKTVGERSPKTNLQVYRRSHSSSHNESGHNILGKLRAGISHQKPEKRHRRTQLRILHLNFKIAQTNGSSALHPIDCLFKEVRQNWENFYEVRPFDSVVKVKDILTKFCYTHHKAVELHRIAINQLNLKVY